MINKEYTYKYTFKPIDKEVVYENNIPVIYYNGEKRLLSESCDFCISSEVKLTRLEACELVKGTIGWELYHGEFKEDESRKSELEKYLDDLDNLIDIRVFENLDISDLVFYHKGMTLPQFMHLGRQFLNNINLANKQQKYE